jgi:hypothetical protein
LNPPFNSFGHVKSLPLLKLTHFFPQSPTMADEHEHDEGDAQARLEEANVDDSQLKLPVFSWEGAQQEVKSMEEDEDVLYKQCVVM